MLLPRVALRFGVALRALTLRAMVVPLFCRFAERRVDFLDGRFCFESSSTTFMRPRRRLVFRRAVFGPPARRSEALVPGAAVSTYTSRRSFSGRSSASSRFEVPCPTRRPTNVRGSAGGRRRGALVRFAFSVGDGARPPRRPTSFRTARVTRGTASAKAWSGVSPSCRTTTPGSAPSSSTLMVHKVSTPPRAPLMSSKRMLTRRTRVPNGSKARAIRARIFASSARSIGTSPRMFKGVRPVAVRPSSDFIDRGFATGSWTIHDLAARSVPARSA